jgi:hypothetical protein
MTRIVFVCTQMEAGGVQTRAHQMKEHLASKGHVVKLIFLYQKRPAFEKTDDTIVLMEKRSNNPAAVIWQIIRLIGIVWRFKADSIVGFAHYASPIAAIIGLICGVRVRVATQTNPPSRAPKIARFLDIICGFLPIYIINVTNSDFINKQFEQYPILI